MSRKNATIAAPAAKKRLKVPVRMTAYGREYLFLMLLLLAVATIGKINLIFLMVGIFLAPIGINRWLARRAIATVRVQRTHPMTVAAGQEFSVHFTAHTSRGRFIWNFLSEDTLTPVVKGTGNTENTENQERIPNTEEIVSKGKTYDTPNALVKKKLRSQTESTSSDTLPLQAFFPGFQTGPEQQATVSIRLGRRGLYRFGPLLAMTEAPFGLYRAEQTQTEPNSDLWVLPSLGRFTNAWRMRRPANRDAGSARRVGTGQEFFGVREWRSGDSPRSMHWRASARHRQWIVRQFADSQMRCVTILLDLFMEEEDTTKFTAEQQRRHREPIERAISMAATLLADLYRGDNPEHPRQAGGTNGGVFRLCLTCEPQHIEPEHFTNGAIRRAMRRLTLAQPHSDDRLESLWKRLAAQRETSREGELIVISLRNKELWQNELGGTHLPTYWLRPVPEEESLFQWRNPE